MRIVLDLTFRDGVQIDEKSRARLRRMIEAAAGNVLFNEVDAIKDWSFTYPVNTENPIVTDKQGVQWSVYEYGENDLVYQRECPECERGMLYAPVRFCGRCTGTGFLTATKIEVA